MEELCNLLRTIYISNSDEGRSAAEQQQAAMMEQNPLEFLLNCLQIACSPNLATESELAVILLFSISKRTKILSNQEILVPFWDQFGEAIQNLFISPSLSSDKKKLLCSIIAEIVLVRYSTDPSVNMIQEYLIQMISADIRYLPWIMYSISEILEYSTDFAGFDPNYLIQLITNESSEPIMKIKLYFAMCYHSDLFPQLHELFNPIIESISPEIMLESFKILRTFSERNSVFFEQHINEFSPYICQIILNNESEDVKIQALIAISAIAENQVYMFKGSQVFHQQFLDMLIQVMSIVDDDSEIDLLNSYNTLASIASDTINSTHKNFEDEYIKQCFENIMKGDNLQLIYGMLLFVGEIDFHILPDNFDDIFKFINHEHPRLRFAAFHSLLSCSKSLMSNNDLFQEVLTIIIQQLEEEKEIVILREITRVLKRLLKVNLSKSSFDEEIYSQLYPTLISCFDLFNDEIIICNILKSTTYLLTKVSWETIEPDFPDLVEFLSSILNIDSVVLVSQACISFGQILYEFSENFDIEEEGNEELIDSFFQKEIEIFNDENAHPKLVSKIRESINEYIVIMGPKTFSKYAESLIEPSVRLISTLPTEIEMSSSDGVVTSGYYTVPNPPNGLHVYFLQTTIESYVSSLKLLQSCIKSLKELYLNYIPDTYAACSQLMTQNYFIEPIRIESFSTIFSIISTFKESDNVSDYIVQSIDFYKDILNQPWKYKGFEKMTSEMNNILHYTYKPNVGFIVSQEKIAELVGIVKIYLDSLLKQKIEIEDDKAKWGLVPYEDCDDVSVPFDNLLKLYKTLGKLVPNNINNLFETNYAESIPEIIKNLYIQKFVVNLLMSHIKTMHNIDLFDRYEPLIISVLDSKPEFVSTDEDQNHLGVGDPNELYADNLLCIYKKLVKIFGKIRISPERARFWVQKTFEVFDYDRICDEMFFLSHSYALSVVAILFNIYFNDVTDDEFQNFFMRLPPDVPTYNPVSMAVKFCISDPERFYNNISDKIGYTSLISVIASCFKKTVNFPAKSLLRLAKEVYYLCQINPKFFACFGICYETALEQKNNDSYRKETFSYVQVHNLIDLVTVFNKITAQAKQQQMQQQNQQESN